MNSSNLPLINGSFNKQRLLKYFLALFILSIFGQQIFASELSVFIRAEWIPNYQEFDGCYRRTVNPDGVELYVSGLPATMYSGDIDVINNCLYQLKRDIPVALVSLIFGTPEIAFSVVSARFASCIEYETEEAFSYTIGVRPVVHYGSWHRWTPLCF